MTGHQPTRLKWLLAFAGALLLALLSLTAPIRYVFLTTELLIAILYATSLNLLMGYGGMLSLGHAAYYALGAYTSGLLLVKFSWPMVPAMLAGPLVAMLGALIFGAFVVRTSHQEHAYFLMLTLAFSQLVFAMIYKWYDLTRGDDGITGIYPTALLADPRHYSVFVLIVVAACLYVMHRVVNSPFGLTLQAIRDNPRRAQFVGLSVRRYQLTAFVIAGLFAGVAGTLYGFFSGTISPQLADWTHSARPFIANTIGGIQSFWGPAVGVLVLEILDTQVTRFTEHSLLAVGALALLVGVFLPQGVVGLLQGRVSFSSAVFGRLFARGVK
jgi:branched-chain amino acid transport system permease protein